MQGTQASFSLVNYRFEKIVVQSAFFQSQVPTRIDFVPSGKYDGSSKTYILGLSVKVSSGNAAEPFCMVDCSGAFKIDGDSVPDFFYANSIAILYPYIRAMVSLVCLQANFGSAVVLPTMNLSGLAGLLKERTVLE